ncbi:NADPH-dependent FMN reductase [Hasllibacter sp. MH4015]|uniref:NADPH-dependent FMN reductase n=1 Tax=Hasllibacter sp. MH4015 TaxID=2854029 RepID=UPI001CD393C2|nr:NAD(P)H-dependent oxidoreductase [Hasllibacter sp. MH4015]
MSSGRLFGLCGSLRAASHNRMLMHDAVRAFDPATFEEGDLRLPLYDADLEEAEGVPAIVQTIAKQIAAADAVIIAGPEYNKAISGVLKNALDWISRADGNPWLHKPVAIMSATAGRSGGERAQASMRECLTAFRPHLVLGPAVLVGTSSEAFENGHLTNEINVKALDGLMAELRRAAGL